MQLGELGELFLILNYNIMEWNMSHTPYRFVYGLQSAQLVQSAEDLVLGSTSGEEESRHGVVGIVWNPGRELLHSEN